MLHIIIWDADDGEKNGVSKYCAADWQAVFTGEQRALGYGEVDQMIITMKPDLADVVAAASDCVGGGGGRVLVILPGGSFPRMQERKQLDICVRLRQFVDQGGLLIGSCAGSMALVADSYCLDRRKLTGLRGYPREESLYRYNFYKHPSPVCPGLVDMGFERAAAKRALLCGEPAGDVDVAVELLLNGSNGVI